MEKSVNSNERSLLSKMLAQFRHRHWASPSKIVVTPQAAVALALFETYGPTFEGIEIESRIFSEDEVVGLGEGTAIGVFLQDNPPKLRSCDLIRRTSRVGVPETTA